MRIRNFRTPFVDCRACKGRGHTQVKRRQVMRGIEDFTFIRNVPCAVCQGKGTRFGPLLSSVVELAYAAARPYAVTLRSVRSCYRVAGFRGIARFWRVQRERSKLQIACIAKGFDK